MWAFSMEREIKLNGVEGASSLGGDSGTRTRNLGDANAALSQLSYIPTQRDIAGGQSRSVCRYSAWNDADVALSAQRRGRVADLR